MRFKAQRLFLTKRGLKSTCEKTGEISYLKPISN